MDHTIRQALARSHTIDITTNGRRTGPPRRIEIVFFNFDGRIYISGRPSPRRRSWLANIEADPSVTFHLKGAVHADLPGTAREITDPVERREILGQGRPGLGSDRLDRMVAESPLIEVSFPTLAA